MAAPAPALLPPAAAAAAVEAAAPAAGTLDSLLSSGRTPGILPAAAAPSGPVAAADTVRTPGRRAGSPGSAAGEGSCLQGAGARSRSDTPVCWEGTPVEGSPQAAGRKAHSVPGHREGIRRSRRAGGIHREEDPQERPEAVVPVGTALVGVGARRAAVDRRDIPPGEGGHREDLEAEGHLVAAGGQALQAE